LFSRLFNNVRVDTRGEDKASAAARGVTAGIVKDLFVHMDQATNALMLPQWAKPTVIGTGKKVNLSSSDAPDQLGVTDRVTLTLKQATEKLEKINREHAEKQKQAKEEVDKAAAAAAAAQQNKQ